MKEIHELYQEAGILHGHFCPGLAIGVRAAWEAMLLLDPEGSAPKDLYCVYESAACYLDGIQWITGCTAGKGNLLPRLTGKTAFSFYRSDTSAAVRLSYQKPRLPDDRKEKIEYILSAPLEELFSLGEPRAQLPSRPSRSEEQKCPVCGEYTAVPYLIELDEMLLCSDCAAALHDRRRR